MATSLSQEASPVRLFLCDTGSSGKSADFGFQGGKLILKTALRNWESKIHSFSKLDQSRATTRVPLGKEAEVVIQRNHGYRTTQVEFGIFLDVYQLGILSGLHEQS